jgi:hypothetical protein
MNRLSLVLLSIILFIFWSCNKTKKSIKKDELISYISDPRNDLIKEKEINGIKLVLLFEPSSLLALTDYEAADNKDETLLNKLNKKYTDHYYFILKISKNGKEAIRQLGSDQKYSDMVQTFSFGMSDYINLIIPPTDTISLSNYVFEQTFGLTDANRILLCFPKSKAIDGEAIYINVGECGFGIGTTRFEFKRSSIENIPPLQVNSQ